MAPSHRRAAGAAIILFSALVLAAAAAMLASVPAREGESGVILGEDTMIDKALFASPMKQCCGMVPWPCCSHESCCDAYEKEGLDKEDKDKALSPQMLEQIPEYRRSGPSNVARGPRLAVEEVPRVYYRERA